MGMSGDTYLRFYGNTTPNPEYVRQNSDGKGGYYTSEYARQQALGATGAGGVGSAPPAMAQPVYNAPAPYETPAAYQKGEYVAPTYDEQRVRDLAQTSGAASMRGLRSQMQKVTGGSYANPNVKRMTLRDALAGYGQGVQAAMSGATDTARNLYNTEYTGKVNENLQNFQAAENAKATNYATAQQKAQMEYQGRLSAAQSQFQANQQKANTEYQTMWNNYNASQDRALKQQALAAGGTAGGTGRITVNYGIPYGTDPDSMAARKSFDDQFIATEAGTGRKYNTVTGQTISY